MLPGLQTLRVVPSPVEFWFWAAFPNPCTLDSAQRLPQGLQSLESLEVHYDPRFNTSRMTDFNNGMGYAQDSLWRHAAQAARHGDEFDFAPFDEFLGRPTLRSLTLVEYPGGHFPRNPERQPLHTLGKRDHLTHIAVPVQALAPFNDGDLVRRVPRGIEHLDLVYPSSFVLDDRLDRLL
ncbi:hypothetical protein AURDEDRAFT_168823 [Auricularia subglabra TFB-10046 SS5]|nr:hypothetical protein AURDEDRAFT_168823 [Auricularia subglabra TFB-10046 SS5]